ncbi:MAG TPA: 4a-hydroxytetrahydrobiopterin dehydratase [Mycobacteriales bacterium]
MADILTPVELVAALNDLPQWTGDAQAIERTVECSTFLAAIGLVDDVAVAAERQDHHPDIDIRWRTVRFVCSTHSAGGVTSLDLTLARLIDELARGR